jgi:hypothetical protein
MTKRDQLAADAYQQVSLISRLNSEYHLTQVNRVYLLAAYEVPNNNSSILVASIGRWTPIQ